MSDYIIKIIPKTIAHRASFETVERIVGYLRSQVPAMDITARVSDEIEFVDCGGNMEEICCPHCGADLFTEWWTKAMNSAAETHFLKISVQTPCCQSPTTLNDLRYRAPCGFSCTEFDILNPCTDKLDDACLQQIAHELGTNLRVIYARFYILGAALMLLGSRLSSSDGLNQAAAFSQLLATAFPFVISIVCQIVAEQELQAGHAQNMLTLCSRRKAIFSKLAILLLSGLFSVAFSTVLFGATFSYFTGTELPVGFFIFIPIVLWASNVMMYGLHLILAFCFGRNFGISIGVVGSLLSALLQTGLGDGRWYVIPYGLGVRFVENALICIFRLSSIKNVDMRLGIIFCILVTCGIIGIVTVWFSRYSGTSSD